MTNKQLSEGMTDFRINKLLMAIRAALLMSVDAIEDYLEMPRTKDLRKKAREIMIGENDSIAGAIDNSV